MPEFYVKPEREIMKLKKSKEDIRRLIMQLSKIRQDMIGLAEKLRAAIDEIDEDQRKSAINLIHYMAFRRHDLRSLQSELRELGLSTLGRSESHVLATIEAVLTTLSHLSQCPIEESNGEKPTVSFEDAGELLARHTTSLLGPKPKERNQYIMVTMPKEAAYNYDLVLCLLNGGMNCMRINCAHDSKEIWSMIIKNLARAREETGLECKVMMDLPGPKLRTGPLMPGPSVLKIRPRRNHYGEVLKPAKVLLTNKKYLAAPEEIPADTIIQVQKGWLDRLESGDTIKFVDARGARRRMKVMEKRDEGLMANVVKTSYLTPETKLIYPEKSETKPQNIEPMENFIPLKPGDKIKLKKDLEPGLFVQEAEVDNTLGGASIGCTIPSVLEDVNIGEPVVFDDGKISGVVEDKNNECLHIRITNTNARLGKLKRDKGINFPLSSLRLPALTPYDMSLLEFVSENADIVALSFVNSAEDVKSLRENLEKIGKKNPSIVVKIETKKGFENLASILLELMKNKSTGVMIARGDLAVESGYERLAEIQEEILWLCEASHIPVIWATQVLESLAKMGAPTRAEITDAAMGHRAECVMLNKGPHILEALTALENILKRMETHQRKKTPILRKLNLAYNLPNH